MSAAPTSCTRAAISRLNGNLTTNETNFLYAGGSLLLRVATTDAIFEPLAAKQELRARHIGLQTARNEALLATADAYFTVQQARGSYGAMVDATRKGAELVRHIEHLSKGLTPRDEIFRARTLLAELEAGRCAGPAAVARGQRTTDAGAATESRGRGRAARARLLAGHADRAVGDASTR